MPRPRLLLLPAALALLVALAAAAGQARAPVAPVDIAAGPPAGMAAAREAAARAGLEWMLSNAGEMPDGWVHPYFLRLHRIVADEPTAARLEAVLREDARSGRHVALPADLRQPALLAPARLAPILFELLRRRQLGLPYEEAARVLEREISENERRFWVPVRATQRATFMYVFGEIGIRTRLDLESIIKSLRHSSETLPAERLVASRHYVYGLTHLVLARSRYFRKHVDPDELGFAVPLLLGSLAHHLEQPTNDDVLDLQGEVLACLQLLRVAEDPVMRATRERLIARQNPDGSWGARAGASRSKVHLTFNAIAGLSELPARMRVELAP